MLDDLFFYHNKAEREGRKQHHHKYNVVLKSKKQIVFSCFFLWCKVQGKEIVENKCVLVIYLSDEIIHVFNSLRSKMCLLFVK